MIVSYVVASNFLDYEEGEIVQLEDSQAEPFVTEGILREATDEDMGEGKGEDEADETDEDEEEDGPDLVANSVQDLKTKMEQAVAETAKKVAEQKRAVKPSKPSGPKVHAEPIDRGFGWKSLGDFTQAVIAKGNGNFDAARKISRSDSAIVKKDMSTGGYLTISGSTGGENIIPATWVAELFGKTPDTVDLYAECQNEGSAPLVEIPIDTTHAYNNGITVSWPNENAAIDASTVPLSTVQLKMKTLAARVNLSNQLMEFNAYGLENYIRRNVPTKMTHAKNRDLLYGDGGGAAVALLSSSVAVTRATASRIQLADINKMFAALHDNLRDGAAWYCSSGLLPELFRMSFPDKDGSYPLYIPTGSTGGYPSMAYKPAGFLMGLPVRTCEAFQALGTQFDLILANFSSVSKIERQVDGQISTHLYFDKNETSLRFVQYLNSVSRWDTYWTRADNTHAGPVTYLSGSSVV